MIIETRNAELFDEEDIVSLFTNKAKMEPERAANRTQLLGCICGSFRLHRSFVCTKHVHHGEEALWKLSCFCVLCLLVSKAT